MGFLKENSPANDRWRVVCRGEDHYQVRRPDGSVYGDYLTLSQAAGIAGRRNKEDDLAMKRMVRPCMCCGHPFPSEGIHNRMCDPCRHRDVAPDPVRVQASRAG